MAGSFAFPVTNYPNDVTRDQMLIAMESNQFSLLSPDSGAGYSAAETAFLMSVPEASSTPPWLPALPRPNPALSSPYKDTPSSTSLTWQLPRLQTVPLSGQPPLWPTTSQEAPVAPDPHKVSQALLPPQSGGPSLPSCAPPLQPSRPLCKPCPSLLLLSPAALSGPVCSASPSSGQDSVFLRLPCAQCWALRTPRASGKAGLEQSPSHLPSACLSVPRSLGLWAKGQASWGLALPWWKMGWQARGVAKDKLP